MPAAVIKGILISISIITALGIAVLESPHIQAWLEDQRRKLVHLLRNIGEELDPESRRAAEAFAFEGRSPESGENTARETSGSIDAVAFATGRSLSGPSRIRQIPVRGPSSQDDAEQRQRQGEAYLAQRNQQMIELRERRRSTREGGSMTPPTPTFDELVDNDGKLKQVEPRPIALADTDMDGEKRLEASTQEHDAWAMGSRAANPFGDEHALDRSETPRPPVPPKPQEYLNMSNRSEPAMADVSRYTERELPTISNEDQQSLSFDEQLALALSLSEAEDRARSSTTASIEGLNDPEMRAAIAASLREFQAASSTSQTSVKPLGQPLIDVSAPMQSSRQELQQRIRDWESSLSSPVHPPASSTGTVMRAPSVTSESTDELYHASPQIAHASLYEWQPLAPVLSDKELSAQPSMDGSFHSAMPSAAAGASYDANLASLVMQRREGRPLNAEQSSTTMDVETETETESFASVSRPISVADSRAEFSGVEIVSGAEETDHDVMSEDDGILTPDSWSEVESRDGHVSETEHEPDRRMGNA